MDSSIKALKCKANGRVISSQSGDWTNVTFSPQVAIQVDQSLGSIDTVKQSSNLYE